MKIVIEMYTGNNCGKCRAAKERLNDLPPHIKENVELVEYNVDERETARNILIDVLESNTLPTFVINKKVYRGFDENFGKIQEELGL